MQPAIVRDATWEDLDRVCVLAERFYREEGFDTPADRIRSHAETLLSSPLAQVLLGMRGDAAVGFAITTTSFGLELGRYAELEDLYVSPDERGRGLARKLIDASRQWAESEGCSDLEVVVDRAGAERHSLVALYARSGFVDHGRRLLSRTLQSD